MAMAWPESPGPESRLLSPDPGVETQTMGPGLVIHPGHPGIQAVRWKSSVYIFQAVAAATDKIRVISVNSIEAKTTASPLDEPEPFALANGSTQLTLQLLFCCVLHQQQVVEAGV
jgi:hypothetical protein